MMDAEGNVSGEVYDAVQSEQISCLGCGTRCSTDESFCNQCGTAVPSRQHQQQQQFFQQPPQQVCRTSLLCASPGAC